MLSVIASSHGLTVPVYLTQPIYEGTTKQMHSEKLMRNCYVKGYRINIARHRDNGIYPNIIRRVSNKPEFHFPRTWLYRYDISNFKIAPHHPSEWYYPLPYTIRKMTTCQTYR